jgi:hypothetical protein
MVAKPEAGVESAGTDLSSMCFDVIFRRGAGFPSIFDESVVSYFREAKAFNRKVRKGFAKVAKKGKTEIRTPPTRAVFSGVPF